MLTTCCLPANVYSTPACLPLCLLHAPDEEAQHKLQLLLHKSVAVAAAFVRDNNLYTMDEESSSDDDDDEYRDTASTSGRSSSSSSSSKSSGFPGKSEVVGCSCGERVA